MPKIVYNLEGNIGSDNDKIKMEKLTTGVVKRKLNPNELGHKSYRSRNKKKCFVCKTYDNVVSEQVIIFGHKTLSYVCIDCRKKLELNDRRCIEYE